MRKISHRIVEYCAHHPNFQRQFDKQSNQTQNPSLQFQPWDKIHSHLS